MGKRKLGVRGSMTFGGKLYSYTWTMDTKREAEGLANSYRRAGDKARIVQTSHGYGVYVRRKGAWL